MHFCCLVRASSLCKIRCPASPWRMAVNEVRNLLSKVVAQFGMLASSSKVVDWSSTERINWNASFGFSDAARKALRTWFLQTLNFAMLGHEPIFTVSASRSLGPENLSSATTAASGCPLSSSSSLSFLLSSSSPSSPPPPPPPLGLTFLGPGGGRSLELPFFFFWKNHT